jgi:hypothetical protein
VSRDTLLEPPITSAAIVAELTGVSPTTVNRIRRIDADLIAKHAGERRSDRWWLIGHIRVLGQSEESQVLNDPETDEGRLRPPKNSTEDDGRNRR